jgi:hypothetical protein
MWTQVSRIVHTVHAAKASQHDATSKDTEQRHTHSSPTTRATQKACAQRRQLRVHASSEEEWDGGGGNKGPVGTERGEGCGPVVVHTHSQTANTPCPQLSLQASMKPHALHAPWVSATTATATASRARAMMVLLEMAICTATGVLEELWRVGRITTGQGTSGRNS